MKKIIYILIVLWIASCSTDSAIHEKRVIKENGRIIKKHLLKIDISKSVEGENDFMFYLNNHIPKSQDLQIVYLINSECSSCVGDFVKFILAIEKSKMNIILYGILNENHSDLINFYLNRYKENGKIKINPILILHTEMYPFSNPNSIENIIVISDGKIVSKFGFSDNQLLNCE